MRKFFAIFSKNLKVLFRNKFSLFILFFFPIIIVGVSGLFYFNDNTYNVNIGISSPLDSSFVESYVDFLKEGNFRVIRYGSDEECRIGIKRGLNHVCIFFPDDFEVAKSDYNEIVILLDSTKSEVRFLVENLVLSSLEELSEGFQLNKTEEILHSVEKSEEYFYVLDDVYERLRVLNDKLTINNNKIASSFEQISYLVKPSNFDLDGIGNDFILLEESVDDFRADVNLIINETFVYLDNLSTLVSGSQIIPAGNQNLLLSQIGLVRGDVLVLRDEVISLGDKYFFDKIDSKIDELDESLNDISESISNIVNGTKGIIAENERFYRDDITYVVSVLGEGSLESRESIEAVTLRDSESIVKPIVAKQEELELGAKKHIDPFIPSLFASLICIFSLFIASNFILLEKRNPARFRNYLSGVSSFKFVLANFFSLFFIVFVLIFLFVMIYYLAFVGLFDWRFILSLLAFIIPGICVFIFLGFVLGYFSSNETSNFVLVFMVVFFLFLFSGDLLPLEVIPVSIVKVLSFNPLLLLEGVFRKVVLFGSNFAEVRFETIILLIYLVGLFIVCLVLESLTGKSSFYQYLVFLHLKLRRGLRRLFGKGGRDKKKVLLDKKGSLEVFGGERDIKEKESIFDRD